MDQLTLSFDPGLSTRHRSLRDCISACIYGRGLERVAGKLDFASSNLSRAISDDPGRKFDINDFENYVEIFEDLTPIYYLIDKFLTRDKSFTQDQLLEKADRAMAEFNSILSELRRASK